MISLEGTFTKIHIFQKLMINAGLALFTSPHKCTFNYLNYHLTGEAWTPVVAQRVPSIVAMRTLLTR